MALWFKLTQDINKLNGDKTLIVSDNQKASDQYFETSVTKFHRGALIIRQTDHEGKKETVTYTDYLAANASTTADTKVDLFEEGDYEVALDYSIVDTDWVDTTTYYRIFFKFKIRNGNCMAFPFDLKTNSELFDNSITSNGFRLDMANSRYLTINVKRVVLSINGTDINEDVRFNQVAKESDEYTDEGMYVITVNNKYTGETVEKTIYVGSTPLLNALSKNKATVSGVKEKLKKGYKINEDGTLISSDMDKDSIDLERDNNPVGEESSVDKKASNESNNQLFDSKKVIIISLLFVVLVCLLVRNRIKKGKKNEKKNEKNN